jgi:hypothetical protein
MQRYKIEKLISENETWFSAKESITLSKITLFGIWSIFLLGLVFFDLFSVYLIIGYIVIILLPTIYLPFYKKIEPIWGLNNPTRHRSMANNLIKLRRSKNGN